MSPDEIFAAHMWPWPDPMLKRDMQGRIVFVNAAFLQLYGGRVEDWRGNSVGGWPAPTPGHAPSRFETRLAVANGERVYDWIEYVLADGFALGFARDVTDLLHPADPPPGDSAAPAELAPPTDAHGQNEAQVAQAEPMAAQVAVTSAQFFPEDTAAQAPSPVDTPLESSFSEPMAAPQDAGPEIYNQSQDFTAEPAVVGHAPSEPSYDTHADTAAPEFTHNPAVNTHVAPAQEAVETNAPAPYVDDTPPVRDHERRALPIENGDAVLGNNWRDAVIAKAVGADLQKDPDSTETTEPETAPKPTAKSDVPIHATPPAGTAVTKADLRILLAEDNAINALLTRTLLEAEGCTVDVVEDGALAVEAVKNARYDMIFMDMRMPNMDGLESTRKIRSLPNVPSDMPIVALTANAFDDDRNACFDSGMNDFMTKPVSAEELSEMVEQWAMTHAQEQRMAG